MEPKGKSWGKAVEYGLEFIVKDIMSKGTKGRQRQVFDKKQVPSLVGKYKPDQLANLGFFVVKMILSC